jgi:hypothetical protein
MLRVKQIPIQKEEKARKEALQEWPVLFQPRVQRLQESLQHFLGRWGIRAGLH